MLTDKEFIRYQRQIMLPEIAEVGQKSLIESSVLIIGCGGLGCAVAMQLAGAGVGKLVLCDDDVLEESNLHRQLSYRESDLGQPKSEALAKHVRQLNSMVSVRSVNRRMKFDSLMLEASMADLVVDCTDNFATRQQINKACLAKKTPLVSGAAIGWDGQLVYFDYQDNGPCYHCLYPFTEDSEGGKCSESGVMGPNVNMIASLQSMYAIQALVKPEMIQAGQLMVFDGRTLTQHKFDIAKDDACNICKKGSKS
ncbi:HesA/MoeB/ThiF family protein [Vibrio rarus]|uniref:HesA/MoeB/ThiF family protein n=1 Tax=Vibrio rarus TaxID=413403 RepID=UPI0021C43173|nr:HesA/MoeB/ThiF family protein [Vibrio rarus]